MKKILLIFVLLPLFVSAEPLGFASTTTTTIITTPGLIFTDVERGNAAAIGVNYIPAIVQLEWTKLIPGMTVFEQTNLAIAGDTIIIERRGVYKIELLMTIAGSTQDDFGIKVYKNGIPAGQGMLRLTPIGTSNYITTYYFWYLPCPVGTNLSFWITNRNRSVGLKIIDMKVLIERVRIPLN